MTLTVTSSQIQIKNNSGIVKFTSSDKLVYLKRTQQGTVSYPFGSNIWSYIPFYALGTNEFLVLTFTINSSSGNVGSGLVGKEIPANGSVLIDFRTGGSSAARQGTAESEYIGMALMGSNLIFTGMRVDYYNRLQYPIYSTSLTYTAKIYSYL